MAAKDPAATGALFVAIQSRWSYATFGSGLKTEEILEHMAEEMEEVRAAPLDVSEWVDLILLAVDGALRCLIEQGEHQFTLSSKIWSKVRINMNRKWPPIEEQIPGKKTNAIKDC